MRANPATNRRIMTGIGDLPGSCQHEGRGGELILGTFRRISQVVAPMTSNAAAEGSGTYGFNSFGEVGQ
jgi:hypothetical protein